MILEKILNELQWTSEGIICRNDNEFHVVHTFLREAVLDRWIYVAKIIGIQVKNDDKKDSITKTIISRNTNVGESYLELINKFDDKIFIMNDRGRGYIKLACGVNRISETGVIVRSNPVTCLYANPEICRSLKDDISITLQIEYGYGYSHMDKNSKILREHNAGKCFPCNTDYSLQAFVRVLPPTRTNVVDIRYYNGMDEETFKVILNNWLVRLKSGNVPKEVKEWLAKFEA